MFFCPVSRRRLCFYLCLLCVVLPLSARADQEEPQQPSLVDLAHQEISSRLVATSRWFDRFFSDPRFEEEAAGTLLRLRGSTTITEGEGLSFDGQIKARVNLPNLERRFHLILSSEDDNIRNETLPEDRINRELAQSNNNASLALQYTQKRSSTFNLTHRLGLDLENGLNPQLRSRVRYTVPVAEQSLLTLTQAVFWEKVTGFGEESRIDYDIPLDGQMLLKTTGQGLFSESSQGYEWLTLMQWLTSFSAKQALSVGVFTAGETRPQNQVTEYNMFIKYRQKFIKRWLYFELKPEVYWLRENNFRTTSAFTLTLEAQFGN